MATNHQGKIPEEPRARTIPHSRHLSAIGSRYAPDCVTRLKPRASAPSITSVRPAAINSTNATRWLPCRMARTTNGTRPRRRSVKRLAMLAQPGICYECKWKRMPVTWGPGAREGAVTGAGDFEGAWRGRAGKGFPRHDGV